MSEDIDPRAIFRALARDRLRALLPAHAPGIRSSEMLPVQGVGQEGAPPPVEIIVYCDRLRSTSASRGVGMVRFRSIVTLVIAVRVERAKSHQVEADLDLVVHLVRNALLTDVAFVEAFEDVQAGEVSREIKPQGERLLGQDGISLDLAFTESFTPVTPDRLTHLRIYVDAADPADKLGDYGTIPGFPAPAPPPRAQGPDGRVEAEIAIDIPQD